jgi:hypothetical protein
MGKPERPGWISAPEMGWLELTNDAFSSDRFCYVPAYGLPLNHKSKNFYFWSDGLTNMTEMNPPPLLYIKIEETRVYEVWSIFLTS